MSTGFLYFTRLDPVHEATDIDILIDRDNNSRRILSQLDLIVRANRRACNHNYRRGESALSLLAGEIM